MKNKALAAVKRRLLPTGSKVRRVPAGLGRGLRMEVNFANQTRLYLGLYETELNRHLPRLCRPRSNVFDLGGQAGYDALVMAKLTGGQVVSVDCDPAAIEQMRRNFEVNPSLAGPLVAWRGLIGARSDRETDMVSIDDLADQTFVPDVVKMDIEEAEAEALQGAERLLSERHPALVIEVHGVDTERQCLELLADKGYCPLVVDQRRWFADHRPIDHNRWLVAERR